MGISPSKPQHFLDPEVNQLALPSARFAIARAFRSLRQPGVQSSCSRTDSAEEVVLQRAVLERSTERFSVRITVVDNFWVGKMHNTFHMTLSFKHFEALSIGWGMSWLCLLRNVKPDQILESENSAFDEKPGACPRFAKSFFDGVEVVTMGCCIGARTSQAEAGDQDFHSGSRYPSLTVMGLA